MTAKKVHHIKDAITAHPDYDIKVSVTVGPDEFSGPVMLEFSVPPSVHINHDTKTIWLEGYEQ